MRASLVSSALIATGVGFAGTLALVVAAAQAVGATPAQTASWITAISLAKALEAGWLSWRYRMPIVTAWSTPGAALIGASAGVAMDAAVGAFVFVALLVLATAQVRPLQRAVERIPTPIAAAMLAGVLLPFVLAAFRAAPDAPLVALGMIGLFALMRPLSPLYAVVVALAGGMLLAFAVGGVNLGAVRFTAPMLQFVAPRLDAGTLLGLGVPLYLVTMAGQNLPGFAVLRAAGYTPPVRSALAVTGTGSLVSALFGAHTTNLAAITAAICTGPEVHPDPAQRWRAGLVYAAAWLALAVVGASSVALLAALPSAWIAVGVGLALIGSLIGALGTAMHEERLRYPALLAFAVTASGVALLGIGAAFWGLAAGLAANALDAAVRRARQRGVREDSASPGGGTAERGR